MDLRLAPFALCFLPVGLAAQGSGADASPWSFRVTAVISDPLTLALGLSVRF